MLTLQSPENKQAEAEGGRTRACGSSSGSFTYAPYHYMHGLSKLREREGNSRTMWR